MSTIFPGGISNPAVPLGCASRAALNFYGATLMYAFLHLFSPPPTPALRNAPRSFLFLRSTLFSFFARGKGRHDLKLILLFALRVVEKFFFKIKVRVFSVWWLEVFRGMAWKNLKVGLHCLWWEITGVSILSGIFLTVRFFHLHTFTWDIVTIINIFNPWLRFNLENYAW